MHAQGQTKSFGSMQTELLATEADTIRAGEKVADGLREGDVIALVGELGAGKTHFVKGVARGLGSAADVRSPTFTLVQEYGGGRLPLYHFDFFRLEAPKELWELGWDEYLDRLGVVIVEWADRFPEFLPPGAHWWELSHDASGGRRLTRRRLGALSE